MKIKFAIITAFLLFSGASYAQQSDKAVNVAPNAPADNPKQVDASRKEKLEEAIKPYIEKAKKTYPEAKERFLKGLPPKETFFITTQLHDDKGKSEQVFIAVKEIKNGKIKDLIWSDVQLVSGYKNGDEYVFPEREMLDWTISKPDGTEEGNFVGKFLDTYQQ